MFLRIKKIKGKEYGYIVKNEWKKRGSRQKVKGYIGRAYRFELKEYIEFMKHFNINDINNYIENNDKNRIINDLIEWELHKFGVDKEEFLIDVADMKIQKNKKDIILLLNEGYMCNLTLKSLIDFKPEDEQTDGYRLARAFVEAGIKVPHEVFIGLFGKIYKTN
ncbi:hypothetical protein HYX02_04600 [Candidatus Woesearchaeota archaeon]|nr:hypothetical protein [Candidatus Woesearchaeota archaeon]